MSTLDIEKYFKHCQSLPKEGSPNNTLTGTKEYNERSASHVHEGLLHLRRLKGI